MELLFSSIALGYVFGAGIVLFLWAVNIYRNSKARVFAKMELEKLVGVPLQPEQPVQSSIEHLLDAEGSMLQTGEKSSLSDWAEFEFEIVSAYLLRQNLAINKDALLKAIETFAHAEIAEKDSLIDQAIERHASGRSFFTTRLLLASYRSQFLELRNVMRRIRANRREEFGKQHIGNVAKRAAPVGG
jgi:hypothetical protein